MRGWKGAATGAIGLSVLYLTVANPSANSRVGGLASGAGNLVRKFLSPAVPAFGGPSSSQWFPGGQTNPVLPTFNTGPPGPSYSQLTPQQQNAINAYTGAKQP